MWESPSAEQQKPRKTLPFLDWMKTHVLTSERLRAAEAIIDSAEREAPEIRRFRHTPETPPWHVEGSTVWHHIRRALAGVLAVTDGADLLEIEEFAREKDLAGEIAEMQRVIRENSGSMITFVLVHDIAKPDVLQLEAPEGSKGAREGFLSHKYRESKTAREDERQYYLKLFRSFEERHHLPEIDRVAAAFFDEYEIRSHYYGHDVVGASEKYQSVRETIGGMFHLSADDLVLIQLAVKYHIDFLMRFNEGVNPNGVELMTQRANRAGIDADDFLDLLLAFTFFDTTVGSYGYENGEFFGRTQEVVTYLRSEFEAMPHRRARREETQDHARRKRRKAALAAAGLSGDAVFQLLGTPFGPERAAVMHDVNQLVDDAEAEVDFGRHRKELLRRAAVARDLLTKTAKT